MTTKRSYVIDFVLRSGVFEQLTLNKFHKIVQMF